METSPKINRWFDIHSTHACLNQQGLQQIFYIYSHRVAHNFSRNIMSASRFQLLYGGRINQVPSEELQFWDDISWYYLCSACERIIVYVRKDRL